MDHPPFSQMDFGNCLQWTVQISNLTAFTAHLGSAIFDLDVHSRKKSEKNGKKGIKKHLQSHNLDYISTIAGYATAAELPRLGIYDIQQPSAQPQEQTW